MGPHLRLFGAIGRVHEEILGRHLPLNGAGVCGAALADIGIPLAMPRGVALLARTAGLLGQLAEEQRRPAWTSTSPSTGTRPTCRRRTHVTDRTTTNPGRAPDMAEVVAVIASTHHPSTSGQHRHG